jgi:hypothetical protein
MRCYAGELSEVSEGEYVSGKIGIVWPTYWRKFLVVAWRSLEGKLPTAVEQKAFLEATRRSRASNCERGAPGAGSVGGITAS